MSVIDATKRADVVLVMGRPGMFAVWASTIENDKWLIAEVPTAAEADAMARRLGGWFRCPAMMSTGTFIRFPAARVS